jgi:hypothetical protein
MNKIIQLTKKLGEIEQLVDTVLRLLDKLSEAYIVALSNSDLLQSVSDLLQSLPI